MLTPDEKAYLHDRLDAATTVEELRPVLADMLKAMPVKRPAVDEGVFGYPFVITDLDPGSSNPVPMSLASRTAHHRIVIGVYLDGSVKVLKNNLGPHEAIPIVSVRSAA